jgi:hypothetical protein
VTGPSSYSASCHASPGPEAFFLYRLANPASKLIVSTDDPRTNFDDVIDVRVGNCNGAVLGCNDDSSSFKAVVTLSSVAAGAYCIIVDSLPATGGTFHLSVTPSF